VINLKTAKALGLKYEHGAGVDGMTVDLLV
jgi:hypothetical protein